MKSVEHSAPQVGLEYRYQQRLMGTEQGYRLTPEGLYWDLGRWDGELPYRDIAFMRFSLRPANLAAQRFLTEIRSHNGLKLTIASVSAKGVLMSEDRGPVYRPFVMALAERVSAASPACRLEAGLPRWRWWPSVFFAVATLAALLYAMGHAVMTGQTALAVMMVVFGGFFIWQIGATLLRNRPRVFTGAIPPDVLP